MQEPESEAWSTCKVPQTSLHEAVLHESCTRHHVGNPRQVSQLKLPLCISFTLQSCGVPQSRVTLGPCSVPVENHVWVILKKHACMPKKGRCSQKVRSHITLSYTSPVEHKKSNKKSQIHTVNPKSCSPSHPGRGCKYRRAEPPPAP